MCIICAEEVIYHIILKGPYTQSYQNVAYNIILKGSYTFPIINWKMSYQMGIYYIFSLTPLKQYCKNT